MTVQEELAERLASIKHRLSIIETEVLHYERLEWLHWSEAVGDLAHLVHVDEILQQVVDFLIGEER